MSLSEQTQKLNQISTKLSEKVKTLVKNAEEKQEWQNLRIMRGQYVQVFMTATPNGGLMLRICGQRLKNCLKITRAKQFEELLKVVAVIGNAENFVKTVEELLKEINGESESEILDLW